MSMNVLWRTANCLFAFSPWSPTVFQRLCGNGRIVAIQPGLAKRSSQFVQLLKVYTLPALLIILLSTLFPFIITINLTNVYFFNTAYFNDSLLLRRTLTNNPASISSAAR